MPTHDGCLCPPPIRDKDGDWYQDTHPSCPVHRGEAPNLGPRGSTRENEAQARGKDLRGKQPDIVIVDDPVKDRFVSAAEWDRRKAAHRATLVDLKERLANSGPPRFTEGE